MYSVYLYYYFLLRATSADTLPTVVSFQHRSMQCDAKAYCVIPPALLQQMFLNDCPLSLEVQQRYTYHHIKVLHILATKLIQIFANF